MTNVHLLSFIRRSLRHAGFYVLRLSDFETVLSSQFMVPIQKCLSGYGFSFDPKEASHPLITLLTEYKRCQNLTYERSSLHSFLHRFNPRNLQEAIFGYTFDEKCRTAKIVPCGANYGDVTVPYLPMPWSTRSQVVKYKRNTLSAEVDDADAQGHKEFNRTIALYESVKQYGYNPNLFSDGTLDQRFIQVVTLRSEGDERFIIMSGHHRVAALSVLGWRQIPVILVLNGIRVVDAANAENWPVVKENVYDLAAAHRVFARFFAQPPSGGKRDISN